MIATKQLSVRDQEALLTKLRNNTDDTSLYVLNTSDLPDAHNRPTATPGEVLMTVNASEIDETVVIRVPHTFVPINLATQGPATKLDILKSAGLNRALATKRIRIIETDAALAIIDQDETTRAEFDRMQQRACRINTDDDITDTMLDEAVKEVNPSLEIVVRNFLGGKITLNTLKAEVRRMQATLNDFDISYLNKEVPLWR